MCTTETNTSEINNIPTQNNKEITGKKGVGHEEVLLPCGLSS